MLRILKDKYTHLLRVENHGNTFTLNYGFKKSFTYKKNFSFYHLHQKLMVLRFRRARFLQIYPILSVLFFSNLLYKYERRHLLP